MSLNSFTDKDGNLLPSKVVTVSPTKKPVTLKIVPPSSTQSQPSGNKPGVANLPTTNPKGNKPKVAKVSKKVESDDELSDHSSVLSGTEEDESEPEEGFYVELALTCVDQDENQEEKNIIFNFESEENYVEHGENGYEDLEETFEDAVSTHYPGWTYANELEEHHIHGNELPEDNELPVVDVQ